MRRGLFLSHFLTACLGWKPRRTIIFCSWGAEEYGLIGSTEWTEVSEAYTFLFGRCIVKWATMLQIVSEFLCCVRNIEDYSKEGPWPTLM